MTILKRARTSKDGHAAGWRGSAPWALMDFGPTRFGVVIHLSRRVMETIAACYARRVVLLAPCMRVPEC